MGRPQRHLWSRLPLSWTRRLLVARRGGHAVGGLRWGPGALGGVLLLAALLAVIVYLPSLARYPSGLTNDQLATHMDNLRGHILQGLGGLALLGTLYFSARTLGLNRRGQVTDRFGKAIEQLGSDSLAIRLGGIYALEQIAFDSAELHGPIMEVLTAYLREHAKAQEMRTAYLPAREGPGRDSEHAQAQTDVDDNTYTIPLSAADHRAIATVIGRRRAEQDPDGQRLELAAIDVSGALWIKARLEGADLREARLVRSSIVEANLERANLFMAHLMQADLRRAHLERANLFSARLEFADLGEAHLEGANLAGAHLEGANLGGAYLQGASLGSAHLQGANLHGAHLEKADLNEAHLQQANLCEAHLDGAHLFMADLEGTRLVHTNLDGDVLHEAHGLTSAQLRGATNVGQAHLPDYVHLKSDEAMKDPAE